MDAPPGPAVPKPGTVVAAQTMVWFQFGTSVAALVVSCAALAVFPNDIADLVTDAASSGEPVGAQIMLAAVPALGLFLVTAAVFGVLGPKLGGGRRWARTATLVFTPIFALTALAFFAALVTAQQEPMAAFGLLIATAFVLAFPVVAFFCLLSGSARRWFARPAAPAQPPY
ncbi:hypothetical protein [Glycomyces sp. NRRL B-16210]|uniref:hypothetical protein n=1 Tax=Glycomyces sp. NRRL B-16210 TaxID=1463821 RepID=UPI0004BF22AF|nr:hypothetical protein [Glycomyces sp. NRRL B-16210]